MRRSLTLLPALIALNACASTAQSAGGYATYDDLARATQACAAKGGRLALVRDGDIKKLQDYQCEKTGVTAQ
mgnify:FL=1